MDKPEIKLSAEALVKLELKDGSSADVVNTAIIKLAADCAEAKDKITLLQGEIDKHKRDAAERMVELALEEQKITPANKQSFIDLALKDPELCKSTLDGIAPRVSLSSRIKTTDLSGIPEDRKNWTSLMWIKNDLAGWKQLKVDSPEISEQIKNKQ